MLNFRVGGASWHSVLHKSMISHQPDLVQYSFQFRGRAVVQELCRMNDTEHTHRALSATWAGKSRGEGEGEEGRGKMCGRPNI